MPRLPSAAVATTAADAARLVEGVVDLDAGPLGTRVTYGNGGRVAGVTVHDGPIGRNVTLYLKVAWGPIPSVADAAIAAATGALEAAHPDDGPWRVDVEVADIVRADGTPEPGSLEKGA